MLGFLYELWIDVFYCFKAFSISLAFGVISMLYLPSSLFQQDANSFRTELVMDCL